jgi:hypothetical protein
MEPAPSLAPVEGRALRVAGVAGLLFAGLLTTSLALLRFDALSADDVASDGLVRVSQAGAIAIYLIPFAGIAFLWFLAVLRRRIGRGEDQFFATVFLGSGLLFIAMLFAAGATAGAAVAAGRFSSQSSATTAVELAGALAGTLFYVFAIKMAAVFMLVSSTIGRRTGFLPRWFILVGMLSAAVMLLSVSFFEPLALIFPAWVAIVSILLLRAHPDTWDRT